MATMTVNHAESILISVKLDPGQPDYETCPWVEFEINMAKNRLSAHAQNCNLSFQWTADDTAMPFLRFISQAHPGLLLEKMAKPDVFDQQTTIGNLWKQAKDENRHELADALTRLLSMADDDPDCQNADCMFCAAYMTIPGANIMDLPGMLVYRHREIHKIIFKIFHVYAQPRLARIADNLGLPN